MKKTTEMAVSDFIRPAIAIKKETEIGEALRLMREKGVEFLSVVDSDHKLIGCVNDVSFMRFIKQTSSAMADPVWFDYVDPQSSKMPVQEIMTTNISTISPEETLDTAFKIMDSVGYKLLHVIGKDEKLLGVITIRGIFQKMFGV
jgi:predicted transcriptional regulator